MEEQNAQKRVAQHTVAKLKTEESNIQHSEWPIQERHFQGRYMQQEGAYAAVVWKKGAAASLWEEGCWLKQRWLQLRQLQQQSIGRQLPTPTRLPQPIMRQL